MQKLSGNLFLAALMLVAALALPPRLVCAGPYQVGGSSRLPEPLEDELTSYVDLIRLGINTDRLRGARLTPEPYVGAVLQLAAGVRRGDYPGCVVDVDSFWGDNVPIGVGDMMSDPEHHEADWGVAYELGTLTGAVVTIPLALRALELGDLKLEATVGDHVPELKSSKLSALTVGQLLRQSTGLPAQQPIPNEVRTREALLQWIAGLSPDSAPGTHVRPSELNLLLLGLILEARYEKPVQTFALEHYIAPIGMSNTTSDLPDQLRSRCAPGEYSEWLGRLAWAESDDPSAYILGASAGHGGLVSNPEDMDLFARTLIAADTVGVADLVSSPTMQMSTIPCTNLSGGDRQGLGWQLGGLGPGSFGWECPLTGSCVWVHPRTQVFVVILANANHPRGKPERFLQLRTNFLRMVRAALPDIAPEPPPPTPTPGVKQGA